MTKGNKKMKVVKETKIPTVKQMSSMACNLREKLDCHVQIELLVDAYDLAEYTRSNTVKVRHELYTSKKWNGDSVRTFESWKKLILCYKTMISD